MQKVVLNESQILRSLDHPFIICCHEAFQTEEQLFLVLDFHVGGTLGDHLSRQGCLREVHVQFYAAEVALALMYLHSRGITHRGLDLSNVLLDAQVPPSPRDVLERPTTAGGGGVTPPPTKVTVSTPVYHPHTLLSSITIDPPLLLLYVSPCSV